MLPAGDEGGCVGCGCAIQCFLSSPSCVRGKDVAVTCPESQPSGVHYRSTQPPVAWLCAASFHDLCVDTNDVMSSLSGTELTSSHVPQVTSSCLTSLCILETVVNFLEMT